jgi:hypothetical protein
MGDQLTQRTIFVRTLHRSKDDIEIARAAILGEIACTINAIEIYEKTSRQVVLRAHSAHADSLL